MENDGTNDGLRIGGQASNDASLAVMRRTHEEEIWELKKRLAELKGEPVPDRIDAFAGISHEGECLADLLGCRVSDGDGAESSGEARPAGGPSSGADGSGQTIGEADAGRSPASEFLNIIDMYENSEAGDRVSHFPDTYENPVNINNEYENPEPASSRADAPTVQKPRLSNRHLGRIEDEFMEWAEDMILQHVHTRPRFRGDHNKIMAAARMIFRTIMSGQSGNLGEREIAQNLGCSQRNVGKILHHICKTRKNPSPSFRMYDLASERFYRKGNQPGDNRPRRWKLAPEAQAEMDRIFLRIERERAAGDEAQPQAFTA